MLVSCISTVYEQGCRIFVTDTLRLQGLQCFVGTVYILLDQRIIFVCHRVVVHIPVVGERNVVFTVHTQMLFVDKQFPPAYNTRPRH